ncbi:hypothetical protein SLS57_009885 [Botryosphaeria dothidea]
MTSRVLQVDYEDVDSMKELLETHEIHTIISTISIVGDSEGAAQLNLIKAAAKSSTTKRLAPSEWSVSFEYDEENTPLMPYFHWRAKAINELRKSDLQWTKFTNGFFLDYYGLPHVKWYLKPLTIAVDVQNMAAALPGTGNEPVTFSYSFDVANFVAAALDLAEWPEDSMIIGDKLTFNDLVKLAERTRGDKFTVTYDDLPTMKRFKVSELPAHRELYPFFPKPFVQRLLAVLGRWTATGLFDLPYEKSLNSEFPNIKTTKAADMLESAWKGR